MAAAPRSGAPGVGSGTGGRSFRTRGFALTARSLAPLRKPPRELARLGSLGCSPRDPDPRPGHAAEETEARRPRSKVTAGAAAQPGPARLLQDPPAQRGGSPPGRPRSDPLRVTGPAGGPTAPRWPRAAASASSRPGRSRGSRPPGPPPRQAPGPPQAAAPRLPPAAAPASPGPPGCSSGPRDLARSQPLRRPRSPPPSTPGPRLAAHLELPGAEAALAGGGGGRADGRGAGPRLRHVVGPRRRGASGGTEAGGRAGAGTVGAAGPGLPSGPGRGEGHREGGSVSLRGEG